MRGVANDECASASAIKLDDARARRVPRNMPGSHARIKCFGLARVRVKLRLDRLREGLRQFDEGYPLPFASVRDLHPIVPFGLTEMISGTRKSRFAADARPADMIEMDAGQDNIGDVRGS